MGIRRYAARIDVAAYDRADKARAAQLAADKERAIDESMAAAEAELQQKIDARVDAELRDMTEGTP